MFPTASQVRPVLVQSHNIDKKQPVSTNDSKEREREKVKERKRDIACTVSR